MVLTRQDWRHTKGRPWGADSNGFWILHAEAGKYDIRLRFRPAEAAGEATLEVANQILKRSFKKDQTQVIFKAIELQKGDLNIQAFLKMRQKTKGPWKVDVIKIS